jgi:hypothetical protein
MTLMPTRRSPRQPRSRRALLAASLMAALLAGCAGPPFGGGGQPPAPNPMRPLISVAAGDVVVVNQEPTVLPAGNSQVVYELPANGSLRFVEGGVIVEGEVMSVTPADGAAQRATANRPDTKPAAFTTRLRKDPSDVVKCAQEGERRVVCRFTNARSGQVFLYTIKVSRDGKALPPLDPSWRIQ